MKKRDVYGDIAQTPADAQREMALRLELWAAEPAFGSLLEAFVADLDLRAGSRVLDLGCGTGAVTRLLAARGEGSFVIGLDPSAIFLTRARSQVPSRTAFVRGDGRRLPLRDASVDAVAISTVLARLPEAEKALAEASRVLRPGGTLGVFEIDHSGTTVATRPDDPLQACVGAVVAGVHDPLLVRRLPSLVRGEGLEVSRVRGLAYAETSGGNLLLNVIDRGADALVGSGVLGAGAGASLKAEARRRKEAGTFFGLATYVSVIARKPS